MKKLEIFSPAFVALLWAVFCFAPGCADTTPPKPVVQDSTVQVIQDSVKWFCGTVEPEKSTKRGAALNGYAWPVGKILRVGFIQGVAYQQRMKDAYTEVLKYANLKVEYPLSGSTDFRWSFVPQLGAYSYIGTMCSSRSQSQETGNIGFRNANNLGVEIHEILHSWGLLHEQASPNANICWNKEVVYEALARTNGWTRAMVDQNVFAKYSSTQATATAYDPISVMQYSVPGAWVCSGIGIPGGNVLSELDKAILRLIYPGVTVTDPPITGAFTLTLQQRKDLLTRVQGFQYAAQISLASAIAATVAADSSVNYTKRVLGL